MKKLLTVLTTLLLVLGICACSKKSETIGEGTANPRVEYKTLDELLAATDCKLQFPIEEAKNIVYAIIGGEVTEIQYTHEGNDYVYRASKKHEGPKDLAGIQGNPTKTEDLDYKLYTYSDGLVATWSTKDGTNYSLYSKTADATALDLEVLRTRGAGNEDIGGMTGGTSIANPMTAHETLEELNTATGLNLVFNVKDTSDVTYTDINKTVAQIDFKVNGKEYTLRASKEAEGYKALAGYHYDKADEETIQAPVTISYFKEPNAHVATWTSGGVNYSLATTANTVEELSNILAQVAI